MPISGRVIVPGAAKYAGTPDVGMGEYGEMLVSEIRGPYSAVNKGGLLFTASAAGVTVPAIAATLVSVFSLYNPRNSGRVGELVDVDITSVLAALVVNTFGWYFSADKNADTATFTTKGTAQPGAIDGGPAGNKIQFYSALTHVGTPVLWDVIGGHHAVTSTQVGGIHKDYAGKRLIMPGTVVSIAASTTVCTTAGLTLAASWIELPA